MLPVNIFRTNSALNFLTHFEVHIVFDLYSGIFATDFD